MSEAVDAPKWGDILPEPFVTLILGSRGAGKTALAHLLTERFEGEDRDAYILGFPEEKADILPEWLEVLDVGEVLGADDVTDVWPEDSVVLVHEAHHLLHARRSMDTENLEVDTLITVSRHKNSDIIFETQQSQRLDRNMITGADAVIFREPALMQAEFERSGMKKLVRNADEVFAQYVEEIESENYTYREKTDEVKKHAYVHADRFEGEYPYSIPLAEHYTEDISKAYAGTAMGGEADESAEADDDGLDDEQQTTLVAVAEWEEENRPLSYSHLGADHEDIPVPHAWNKLSALHSRGYLEKTYSSSNKPTRYRLTEEGWEECPVEEPDTPLLEDEEDD